MATLPLARSPEIQPAYQPDAIQHFNLDQPGQIDQFCEHLEPSWNLFSLFNQACEQSRSLGGGFPETPSYVISQLQRTYGQWLEETEQACQKVEEVIQQLLASDIVKNVAQQTARHVADTYWQIIQNSGPIRETVDSLSASLPEGTPRLVAQLRDSMLTAAEMETRFSEALVNLLTTQDPEADPVLKSKQIQALNLHRNQQYAFITENSRRVESLDTTIETIRTLSKRLARAQLTLAYIHMAVCSLEIIHNPSADCWSNLQVINTKLLAIIQGEKGTYDMHS